MRQEFRLIAALIEPPPWRPFPPGRPEDRGLRAAYRRWTPATGEPGYDVLAPIWQRLNELSEQRHGIVPNDWMEEYLQACISRTAQLLHLTAQSPDTGEPCDNFGAACRKAGVAEARFARLVTPPPDPRRRLEAFSRAFRRFRQQNVRLVLVDEDGSKPHRYAELEALYAFLFLGHTRAAVSRWARGFYWQPKKSSESIPENI
jgi:hypothetical protein